MSHISSSGRCSLSLSQRLLPFLTLRPILRLTQTRKTTCRLKNQLQSLRWFQLFQSRFQLRHLFQTVRMKSFRSCLKTGNLKSLQFR